MGCFCTTVVVNYFHSIAMTKMMFDVSDVCFEVEESNLFLGRVARVYNGII